MKHHIDLNNPQIRLCGALGCKMLISLLLLLSSPNVHLKAQAFLQYASTYSDVEPQSGILLNIGFIQRLQIKPFLGPANPKLFLSSPFLWKGQYELIRQSVVDPGMALPELASFYTPPSAASPIVPLACFYVEGDYIDHSILFQHYDYNTHKIKESAPQDSLFLGSMINLRESLNSNVVQFEFDTLRCFTNRPKSEILSIVVDLDDGQGLIIRPFENFTLQATYGSLGPKRLIFKLVTTKNTFVSYSIVNIVASTGFTGTEFKTISTTLPSGQIAEGFYSLDLSCDQKLDRPFIIVEGFDPQNSIDSTESQQKYFDAGMLSYLLEHGYDIVGLQFKTNNDSIQNNAKVVAKLIQQLNEDKEGHFENIIIGESNGGLNTRIALAEMEAQGIDHETGLYISFDSPHAGANTPLGMQEFGYDSRNVDFSTPGALALGTVLGGTTGLFIGGLAGLFLDIFGGAQYLTDKYVSDEEKIKIIESNESPAARQQQIRHRDREYKNQILSTDYLDFQSFLKQVGYPQDCRKIALINGSNTAQKQDSNYEDKIIDKFDIDWTLFELEVFAKISPINTLEFRASAMRACALFICLVDETGDFNFATSKPYDIAPGAIIKNSAFSTYYSFAHSASTIDLIESIRTGSFGIVDTEDGLFYWKEDASDPSRKRLYIVTNHLTPFDDLFANSENSPHISLLSLENLIQQIDVREFMLYHLYLQNKTISAGRKRQFHADQTVQTGRNVSQALPEKIIEQNDFVVQAGAEASITAGKKIQFKPGTKVEHGGALKAKIKSDTLACQSFFSGAKTFKQIVPIPVIEKEYDQDTKQTTFRVQNPYTGASSTDYQWNIVGNGISENFIGHSFTIDDLPLGIYCVECSLFDGDRQTIKFFEVKDDENNSTVTLRQQAITLLGTTEPGQIRLRCKAPALPGSYRYELEKLGEDAQWIPMPVELISGEGKPWVYFEVIDSFPSKGLNFYRVHGISGTGENLYAETTQVFYSTTAEIKISPNPVNEMLSVDLIGLTGTNGKWQISDLQGRTWKEGVNKESGSIRTRLDGLPDGVYVFTYSTEDQAIMTQRFVVSR